MSNKKNNSSTNTSYNFIQEIVNSDLDSGGKNYRVHTRFPPEPNGYLHIGHAKSICLNFGIADATHGLCNLRFDDTNPGKENIEYVDSIKNDILWLGFNWQDRLFFASDYFEKMYEYALVLIKKNKAYVCDLTAEEIRQHRGTLTEPGKNSPYRDRTVDENIELFRRMRNGKFEESACVLRAKIDMESPNINLRDPIIYRIRKEKHHRTNDAWCIYPMYDFAHCISDSIEGITHSICTLEFENHRPLYNWFLEQIDAPSKPRQIEFARLNLTYTIMSKRKLQYLVEKNYVNGWDDPRMPTLAGLRRRGITPNAIKNFCERIGVAKANSTIDVALLEYFVREDLNKNAQRIMAVLRPLKIIITNYPEGKTEELDAINNPEDEASGMRKITFSKVIYIEEDDFSENPPPKFFRLSHGKEIRLKHAYYIKCTDVIKDSDTGKIIELHCTYDPESRGGWSKDGRKVKGTSHWVSEKHSLKAEIRFYENLFTDKKPNDSEDIEKYLNKNSLKISTGCLVEEGLRGVIANSKYQFLRQGYFCVDQDTSSEKLVFNHIVSLRDSWGKQKNKIMNEKQKTKN